MGPIRKIGSIVVIIVAGAVAYLAYAAGDAGPMVTFGHGDANDAAADAWHQLPLHVSLAIGFALAGPTGARSLAWNASFGVTAVMSLWAAALVLLGLSSLGDYADVANVVVSAVLVLAYAAALLLSWRPFDAPDARATRRA